MSAVAFTFGDLSITWAALIILAACAQWIVFLVMRLLYRGIRPLDKPLLISSAIFAVAWIAVLTPAMTSHDAPVATASTTDVAAPQGSCASVSIGISARRASALMGKPDEVRSDEESRGPGAEMWIYRGSRCTVHVFDGLVEFVD
jgi:hypothetical protein